MPKYRRRLPSIDKTIHQLWIEGLAHRDFEPTLRGLLGATAPLSASTIARVNAEFGVEFAAWKQRRLEGEHSYICGPTASISVPVPQTSAACYSSWSAQMPMAQSISLRSARR